MPLSDNNPATLTLTVDNGICSPATVYNYPINRTFIPSNLNPYLFELSGPTCVDAGLTTNTFSVPTNAINNLTAWLPPVGWSITSNSSNGTNSVVNITVPANALVGAYTVGAQSKACPDKPIELVVNVKPKTPSITSPTCINRGLTSITSISCVATSGVTSYTWTMPAGWSCTNCTTSNPTFVPSGTINGPVTLSVVANGTNGCNNTATSGAINYNAVTPDTITANCWSIGGPFQAVSATQGGVSIQPIISTQITIANRPNPFFGTYIVQPNAALFSGYSVDSATGIITLNNVTAIDGTTYQLVISHNSLIAGATCGTSAQATVNITAQGNGTSSIGFVTNSGGSCDQYATNNNISGAVYTWFVNGFQVFNNGSTINAFQNSLTLCGNIAPTSVIAQVAINGCITRVAATSFGLHGSRSANTSGTPVALGEYIEGVTIYPNPNNGIFFVKVDNFKTSAKAILTDNLGKEIATYILKKGDNKISNENIAKGTYTVVLQIDGKQEARQVIIR